MAANELKDALQGALLSKNPDEIASALEIPSFSQSTGNLKSNRHRPSKFSLNDSSGADWGNVLNALISAHHAALEVSFIFCITSSS